MIKTEEKKTTVGEEQTKKRLEFAIETLQTISKQSNTAGVIARSALIVLGVKDENNKN